MWAGQSIKTYLRHATDELERKEMPLLKSHMYTARITSKIFL
jgi:hypothetical protein